MRFETFDKGIVVLTQVTATATAQNVGTLVGKNGVKFAKLQVTANNAFVGDATSQTYPVDANETLELETVQLDTLYIKRNGGSDATVEILLVV